VCAQQWRLIPYLAAAYAMNCFSKLFFAYLVEIRAGMILGADDARQAELGRELHAVSCASKPVSSWLARDTIQECREACGGHGYLKGGLGKYTYLRAYVMLITGIHVDFIQCLNVCDNGIFSKPVGRDPRRQRC
jgi:hypothetical protein